MARNHDVLEEGYEDLTRAKYRQRKAGVHCSVYPVTFTV